MNDDWIIFLAAWLVVMLFLLQTSENWWVFFISSSLVTVFYLYALRVGAQE